MTFTDFKAFTSALLVSRGDKRLPDDAVIKPLMLQAMVQIAMKTTPLSVMGSEFGGNVLRKIEDDVYIYIPTIPAADEDEVIFEEELTYATANFLAASVSVDAKNGAFYNHAAMEWIQMYDFKLYNTPTEA